ncbi:MAG: hybrid sensor histidine kinase/response regulator, partial [Gammaproteobacteria bacterium]|nr:hybrid sensor histidine kinase/response regulator [Gammaproteobacteria bacterium]
ALMRASHSIKGAARMVDVDCGVRIAHAMEDIFVAAQDGKLSLNPEQIDVLLHAVDLLTRIASVRNEESSQWLQQQAGEVTELLHNLHLVLDGGHPIAATANQETTPAETPTTPVVERTGPRASLDTAIRVSPESLNRLMGLAGEVRVESRWLRPFAEGLVQVKHRQVELIAILDRLSEAVNNHQSGEYVTRLISEAQHKAGQCRHRLADRLGELEEYDRRSHNLADRLNREVVASRMRPFSDGVQGFQRMVRDLARSLNKDVRLVIEGLGTRVDRDILSKVEAPLNHLVRNAVDHGVETVEERRAAGKPEQATITLEATHSAGMLSITVRDDGRGIEVESLRGKVVEKGLTSAEMAAKLSEAELMEFLFLPGFSTRDQVTEISGRGVGLDVVHSAVQEMRGMVRATSTPGQGLQFHMQLPLTLSVVRALLVEIGGEPYAFPLARIERTLSIHRDHIETMEGRQYFTLGNQHIGMLSAHQVLELENTERHEDTLPIVVLGERMDRYGLAVDRLLGERNLVVQTLDPRLGKVQDVSAAAILENGSPCLILDVDDLIRSIDILIAGGRLDHLGEKGTHHHVHRGKRVLVVDDSITVREVERNMLVSRGYAVDVAVDGMDGWNAVRTGHYDLVISDVDMPRMNGFEFVAHIKEDPTLKSTPVMIVSYKDREEDRARGLEVGADYYLTKGSFHDETLLDAVLDLIGEA